MNIRHKATSIRLLDFTSVPMRAFHMAWLAFFLCFFGWFGIAPLMPIIRTELHLTKEQVGNSAIAAVAITILVRVLMGWLCDRIGPRRAYTWLLVLGSLPVMGIGLAHDYRSFLFFRLAIGAIGASLRDYAVPHVGDVRSERGGDRKCHHGRVGESRRRCNAVRHAAARWAFS